MKKLYHIIRFYPLSSLSITAIWAVCMLPIPHTPIDNVRFIDKYVHTLMYLVLVLIIWGEYLHWHKVISWHKLMIWGVAAPFTMGGAVELAQAYCTNGCRSGDWLDFLADGLGVALAAAAGCVICILLARYRARDNKDS